MFAAAREAAGAGAVSVQPGALNERMTALAEALGADFARVLDHCSVLVDGVVVRNWRSAETWITSDTEVAVLPPVSGG
jgi:molybdopterin converting factor small subunit